MTYVFSETQQLAENIIEQMYLLDYLAILLDNIGFNQVINDFCNQFSLSIEESDKDYIAASGDDFAIQAKVVPLGRQPGSKVILLKVMTDSEYDLQIARELIEEQITGNNIFAELILLLDSVAEKRTREAYLLLNELENMLRKVVAMRAASLSGQNWWKDRVQRCLIKRGNDYQYEQWRDNEVGDQDITPKKKPEHHDIFYLDLSSLKNVIEDQSNWKDGFSGELKVLQNIERLDLLNRLRRKIAHNRFLSQRNLDDLRQIHSHLIHLCRRSIGEL